MDEQIDERAYRPTDAGIDKGFSEICQHKFTCPRRNTQFIQQVSFLVIIFVLNFQTHVCFFTYYGPSFGQKNSPFMSNSPELVLAGKIHNTVLQLKDRCAPDEAYRVETLKMKKATEFRLCSGFPVI